MCVCLSVRVSLCVSPLCQPVAPLPLSPFSHTFSAYRCRLGTSLRRSEGSRGVTCPTRCGWALETAFKTLGAVASLVFMLGLVLEAPAPPQMRSASSTSHG